MSRDIWGDTAYHTHDNKRHLKENSFRSQLYRKKPKGKPVNQRIEQSNKTKSKVRATVEHIFASQKDKMGLFITPTLKRVTQRNQKQLQTLRCTNDLVLIE
jgi:hypothetical protein